MNSRPDKPHQRKLLEAFVASNRCEQAFAKVVESLSGLVYTSALRRTRDSQLAEEVMQNVFALMARKADSLQKHPSLTAWALETVRLQAATVTRSERRRQRKIATLASEANTQDAMSSYQADQDASWMDAVPMLDTALDRLPQKDRQVICQRFYDGMKFQEIATENGQTEAACKMRVKRALEKISKFLTGRGVTLSATAVATGLGTEFARSAPAQAVASVAPQALAASSSISSASIIANTFQTMSTLKTTTASAVAVIALAAIPFSSQYAEGSRMRTELEALENPAGGDGREVIKRLSALPGPGAGGKQRPADPLTPAEMLDWLDNPAEPRAWLKSLMEVAAGSDILANRLLWAQMEQMSPQEQEALIEELQRFPCMSFTRIFLQQKLAEIARELPPRERLDRMLEEKVEGLGYSKVMSDWAEAEPAEALAWYKEKRASEEVFGEGLESNLQKGLLGELLSTLAKSMPGEALDLYLTTPEEELSADSLSNMTQGLAEAMAESGVDIHLVRLLDDMDGTQRQEALRTVVSRCGQSGNFASGMDLFDKYEADPEQRLSTIDHMFGSLRTDDLVSGALDWVNDSMETTDASAVIRRIATSNDVNPNGIRQWIESQPPGGARDHAHAGRVDLHASQNRFPRAMAEAANIQDPILADSVRESAARRWLDVDVDAATQALPSDLLDKLLNR